MQKIVSFLTLVSLKLHSFAQAWVWDEITQEAEESEPINFFHLIITAILCVIIWLEYLSYKYIRTLNNNNYLKIRKITIVTYTIISIIIPISILTFFDLKRDSLESNAYCNLNNIINNAGSYIELNNNSYVSFIEINPRDNQVPNNLIKNNSIYRMFIEYGVTPHNGIYRCFNIKTLGSQVIFAKDAKLKGFSSEEKPALFHGYIRPFRIRYYSPNNINPNLDLGNVYHNFIQDFIYNHNSQLNYDITTKFFQHPLNEYYEINHIPSGDEMWAENKLYYENDIVQERSYEYKTINYGNFDVTYCISRPCKLGVCEKYAHGNIFGKKIFDKIHLVKRYECLSRFGCIWVFFSLGIFAIFYFSRPSRK